MRLILVPLDTATDDLARKVAGSLRRIIPWKVVVSRRQETTHTSRPGTTSNAITLIESIADAPSDDTIEVAITPHDITIPGRDYVFGYALPERNMAIVSTFRLVPLQKSRHPVRLLTQRVCKEVLHEAGHVKGLEHCTSTSCVMHYSQTLHDTDLKPCKFCPTCVTELSRLPHVSVDLQEE
ncbi:MAG: hypothetical protein JW846_02210 [Dehalococcoidia bacterium]|nr:hypothetical protein [Dehalococcoidia bacterium]